MAISRIENILAFRQDKKRMLCLLLCGIAFYALADSFLCLLAGATWGKVNWESRRIHNVQKVPVQKWETIGSILFLILIYAVSAYFVRDVFYYALQVLYTIEIVFVLVIERLPDKTRDILHFKWRHWGRKEISE